MERIKIAEFSRRMGVTRATAINWFNKGYFKNAIRLPSGTIYVYLNPDEPIENCLKGVKRNEIDFTTKED